jgi:hypothetical protein
MDHAETGALQAGLSQVTVKAQDVYCLGCNPPMTPGALDGAISPIGPLHAGNSMGNYTQPKFRLLEVWGLNPSAHRKCMEKG